MRYSIYLAIPLLGLLAVVQTAVLPRFPLLGASPQLPFLFALAWGLLHTPEEGMIWAFAAGLWMDVFSITPMGVTALVYVAAVTAVLIINNAFPTSRLLMPALMAGLATMIAFLLTLLFLRIWGGIPTFQAVSFLPIYMVVNTIFILPIYWVIYALERKFRPKRVQL
jgi:rod shape-determining protein MreD